MAHRLSLINRFNGAWIEGRDWSAAAHSLLVEVLVGDASIYGYALVHDAHEAWVQDITSPMKGLIKAVAGFDVIGTIADKFDAKIHERFGLPYPVPTYAEIGRASCRERVCQYV